MQSKVHTITRRTVLGRHHLDSGCHIPRWQSEGYDGRDIISIACIHECAERNVDHCNASAACKVRDSIWGFRADMNMI